MCSIQFGSCKAKAPIQDCRRPEIAPSPGGVEIEAAAGKDDSAILKINITEADLSSKTPFRDPVGRSSTSTADTSLKSPGGNQQHIGAGGHM